MINLKSDLSNQVRHEQGPNPSSTVRNSSRDLIQIKDYIYHSNSVAGRGKTSTVFKAVDVKSNKFVAIKKVSKKTLNSEYLISCLVNEIDIQSQIKHPNVVGLKEVIRSTNSIYLVLEYCNSGTLRDYLRIKGKLQEKEAKQILSQIIQGMDFLLQNNILHRDLKPENVLCHYENDTFTFKICDFGFSKKLDGKDQLLQSAIGSPQYMDLQRLCGEGYSAKSDVFSLGVIAYEMIFGCPPWLASNWYELKSCLIDKPLDIPEDAVSKEMEMFLRKTLAISERDRASWDDLRSYNLFWNNF